MQRLLLVLLVTAGAVSLSGCGLFNSLNEIDQSVDDSNNPTDQIAQPIEAIGNTLPGLPEGEDSETVVAVSNNSPTVIAGDLIQSTNPNERTISVERTRPDPFAELTIPLIPPQPIEVPGTTNSRNTTTTRNGGGQKSPGSPVVVNPNFSQGRTSGSTQASSTQTDSTQANSTSQEERPTLAEPRQLESTRPEIAVLPEIPKPDIAESVLVTGVIQIGNSPYAIVKAPNEIERYVRQGERIAGGRVFVKRVDTRSAEPRVVLVENGIEVERFVAAPSDESGTTEEIIAPSPPATVSTISNLPSLPNPGI